MAMTVDTLDADEIRAYLGPSMVGVPIYVFDRVSSTNDTVHQLFDKIHDESFFAVLAEEQESARGRRGRVWVSPRGSGLTLSIGVSYPLEKTIRWDEWPLLAALAVREAIGTNTGLSVKLKWPNDLLINEKKVCGILCEAVPATSIRRLVVGIGVNVNTAMRLLPHDVQERATSLLAETGEPWNRNMLAAHIVVALHSVYVDSLNGRGFAERRLEWLAQASTIGRHVQVMQGNRLVEGLAVDVDERGTLHIKSKDGIHHEVISGEIVEGGR